jgi:hypothetical protein
MIERQRIPAVGEGHVVEADLPAHARELLGVHLVRNVRLLVEQLEDLVERRHAGLVGGV